MRLCLNQIKIMTTNVSEMKNLASKQDSNSLLTSMLSTKVVKPLKKDGGRSGQGAIFGD